MSTLSSQFLYPCTVHEQRFGPTAKMTAVMDPELKRRLKAYCNETQQSAASVLDRLIRAELAKWEEK